MGLARLLRRHSLGRRILIAASTFLLAILPDRFTATQNVIDSKQAE
jgi:hypothetical protein